MPKINVLKNNGSTNENEAWNFVAYQRFAVMVSLLMYDSEAMECCRHSIFDDRTIQLMTPLCWIFQSIRFGHENTQISMCVCKRVCEHSKKMWKEVGMYCFSEPLRDVL